MNTAAVKKTEIIKQLSRASEKDLDRIGMCIESVLAASTSTAQKSHSLKGIWKGKGFDRLEDLEEQIKQAKRELGESILKREL
jgi:hypothetical protein